MIKKYHNFFNFLLFTYISFLTSPAFAEFKKAGKLLGKVEEGLRGLSLVSVTIAVLWVGYKVLFGGSTLRECAPIIIGAIIIASAAEIGKLLIG